MTANFATRTGSTRDDWQTPLRLVEALGRFDLDPCANTDDPTRCAGRGLTVVDDGLAQPWSGRVWLNPPYGRDTRFWMSKLAYHGNGIALIPPRMGSAWFQDIVLGNASALLFLKGRVSFINSQTGLPESGNNADSALVAYGHENVTALSESSIPGVIWRMRP